MTRAAIYTRISRADNGDRSGVERHADLCRQLCDLRGYEVTDVYEDNDTSATSAKRPAFPAGTRPPPAEVRHRGGVRAEPARARPGGLARLP